MSAAVTQFSETPRYQIECELSEKCEFCEMCELCDERNEDPRNEGRALLYPAEADDRLTNAGRLSIIGGTPCPV